MTPQQIELVKATVPVLRENGVALTGYFYNRMLGNNPELKEKPQSGDKQINLGDKDELREIEDEEAGENEDDSEQNE